jgi:hypothetical protein
LNGLDLGPERLVFSHLARKKRPRQPRLLGDAFSRQDIGVTPPVLGGGEITELDQPFVQKRGENINRISESWIVCALLKDERYATTYWTASAGRRVALLPIKD